MGKEEKLGLQMDLAGHPHSIAARPRIRLRVIGIVLLMREGTAGGQTLWLRSKGERSGELLWPLKAGVRVAKEKELSMVVRNVEYHVSASRSVKFVGTQGQTQGYPRPYSFFDTHFVFRSP